MRPIIVLNHSNLICYIGYLVVKQRRSQSKFFEIGTRGNPSRSKYLQNIFLFHNKFCMIFKNYTLHIGPMDFYIITSFFLL